MYIVLENKEEIGRGMFGITDDTIFADAQYFIIKIDDYIQLTSKTFKEYSNEG